MPSRSATIVPPSRAAPTRACDSPVAPLDITARANAYHARQLRIALRQWLHTAGVAPALAEDLTLASYEAVVNVVEHAYPPDHLHPGTRLQAQMCLPLLRITITDSGHWRLPTQEAGYRGRGLAIMRAVTTRTRLIQSTHGTTVVLFAGLPLRCYQGSNSNALVTSPVQSVEPDSASTVAVLRCSTGRTPRSASGARRPGSETAE